MTQWPGGPWRIAVACALLGCGRYGYDAVPDEIASDAAPPDVIDSGILGADAGGPVSPVDAAPPACDETCPGQCSSSGRCEITCPTGGCDDEVVCPPGQICDVMCAGIAGCPDGVDCSQAAGCNVTCSGFAACPSGVVCPVGGTCTVACSGYLACLIGVDCSESCACDVSCDGDEACLLGVGCPDGCDSEDGCSSADECSSC